MTRDIGILSTCVGASVGFSIPTDDDRVRQVLEPQSPAIRDRIEALRQVHDAGSHTWVFIAPMLPMDPDALVAQITPHIDYAMIDALNYRQQAAAQFRQHGWGEALTNDHAERTGVRPRMLLGEKAQRD